MDYKLTNSQQNFYGTNSEYYSTIWNHGGMELFNKVYTYDELNTAFNKLIQNFESLRIYFKNNEKDYSLFLKKYEFKKYPFIYVETEKELIEASNNLTNSSLNSHDELITCIVFNTPTKSGYIFCAHHIIIDGYSTQIMGQYLNNCLKNNLYSPENIQSYEEYISNEEMYKSSKRYHKDQKFWLQQFSLNPQCSIFEEKKTSFDYESDEVNFRIDTDLFYNIKSCCNNNNISVQSFFNTVYSVYIYRTLGVDFFTLGVPVLNRTTEAELNTIGLYMHIVPLIVKVSDESFVQNALNIEDAQMTLFRHQKFTQYDIKELLKKEGKPQNNLFDIAVDYQAFEENEDYDFEFVYSNSLSLPLEIHMQSFGDKNHNLKIRYRKSIFSEKEIQTMLNSFVAIIQDAIKNPDKKISDLDMLSDSEKNQLLYEFNNTTHSYNIPESSTLYSIFEKTSKENADKICLTASDKSLTFSELRAVSEALDLKLRQITDSKKSVIAVIAERSVEMYAAIYGIIRGGNAYLPIDPDYPQDRIDFIIQNSEAKAVVAQGKFAHLAGNTPCVDMTEFLKKAHNISPVPCLAEPEDTAYVIYTSGSTGTPKGAKVSHKSAVNRILWMHDKYPLLKDDVILQKTPYTFDVSVWELFWWGICGGSLAVSKPGEHFLPAKILDEVENNKVTHLHFVPSVFELFLNYLENHKDELYKFESVKYVFVSGEALMASLVQRFYALFSYEKVTLHNLYGPTECAVDVTYYDCRPDDIDPVPIGKPIYNTQIYITDKNGNLVPIGVTGELCIAGDNVGQGYLNRPELTAEKFIDNPFGEGKMYRTGDNAYWREDGQIIYCGRKDSQIKLNGQRIEIGEIEAVISTLNEVETVAVIVRKVNARNALVAFYSGKNVSETTIKDVCRNKLPKYMVPSFAVHTDKLPLNKNGKLDREALSKIDIITSETETGKPINDTEKYICQLFEEFLGEKNIGRNSDFFELGGTSYTMISLLSENGFENITAADFMKNPTPALLASLLNRTSPGKTRYLEALYAPDNAKKALIVLPFAGGGAEAFSNLVLSLKKVRNDIAVYFIRYLHSLDECDRAATEIADVLKGTEIMFYSHCVGSAVALQIISQLEKRNISVSHYFAAASIPPVKPKTANPWHRVSDRSLKKTLIRAGAEFGNLTDKTVTEFLSAFRQDTDFMGTGFSALPAKIKTPTGIILSKHDLFTKKYKRAETFWKHYSDTIVNVSFINSQSHYFQSSDSDELVQIIVEDI